MIVLQYIESGQLCDSPAKALVNHAIVLQSRAVPKYRYRQVSVFFHGIGIGIGIGKMLPILYRCFLNLLRCKLYLIVRKNMIN